MTLASSKNDLQGNLVQRKHQCYCQYVSARLCPFHTALAFEKIRPSNPEAPLFVSAHGDELTKAETIALIRKVLGESKVELQRAGAQGQQWLERFNGHVFFSSFWCAILCKVPDPVAHHHASRKMGKPECRKVCAGGSTRDQHIRKWLRAWPCCGRVRP